MTDYDNLPHLNITLTSVNLQQDQTWKHKIFNRQETGDILSLTFSNGEVIELKFPIGNPAREVAGLLELGDMMIRVMIHDPRLTQMMLDKHKVSLKPKVVRKRKPVEVKGM